MFKIYKYVLPNGLIIIFNKDKYLKNSAVFNILYKVGSKDENFNKTGIAHLFEHLMFCGSKNITDYDHIVSNIGGINNAFTSQDYTNYYIELPNNKIETAFYTESDRMCNLNITKDKLDIQKKVVIEEFKQIYFDKPYGLSDSIILDMAYDKYQSYKWNVIGKNIDHIYSISIFDIKEWYKKYYNPNNAIISIVGNYDIHYIYELSYKWFNKIENNFFSNKKVVKKNINKKLNVVKKQYSKIINNTVYKIWNIDERLSKNFYMMHLFAELLSGDKSSKLYQSLVINKNMFLNIDAYIIESIDCGLFVIEGKIYNNIKLDHANIVISNEIINIIKNGFNNFEIKKVQNQTELRILFNQMNIIERAFELSLFEMMGNYELYNKEIDNYNQITSENICECAKKFIKDNNCSTLYYIKNE
ncbi:MAG: insulinase family protein [Bacteroides sp.]|nr:MAG: insulinase family protein [Bacteroides sp.]